MQVVTPMFVDKYFFSEHNIQALLCQLYTIGKQSWLSKDNRLLTLANLPSTGQNNTLYRLCCNNNRSLKARVGCCFYQTIPGVHL